MAKKDKTAFIGGGTQTVLRPSMESEPTKNNHPSSGLCPQPNKDLHGSSYKMINKRLVDAIAPGESAQPNNPPTSTANGISRSFGIDKGRQYNWGDSLSGSWNDNNFDSSNLTGM